MPRTITFEKVFICTSCLEQVSEAEMQEGHSPCCWSLMSDQDFEIRADFFDFYEELIDWLGSSSNEKSAVLEHVKTMSPNSKKRRKMYNPPANKWPGRLSTATTKKAMRKEGANLKKRPRGGNKGSQSLDITSDNSPKNFPIRNSDQWTVQITGQYQYTISGANRAEARKKARSWLRSQGTSIVMAAEVTDGEGVTNIHYE